MACLRKVARHIILHHRRSAATEATTAATRASWAAWAAAHSHSTAPSAPEGSEAVGKGHNNITAEGVAPALGDHTVAFPDSDDPGLVEKVIRPEGKGNLVLEQKFLNVEVDKKGRFLFRSVIDVPIVRCIGFESQSWSREGPID